MHRLKRYAKFLSILAIFSTLLAAAGIGGIYYVYGKGLPSSEELKQWHPAQATRILDRNGNLLYEIHGEERRVVVPSDQISDNLKRATIAIEDKRFYDHFGVDPKGILRAAVMNIKAGQKVEGGSTITQQLAKNAYLTSKRTWNRKIRELFLAVKLERSYSKDEILTMYLNEIGYGSNAYGAEAAANMYFDKSAKDLTVSESAMLAAITKSPTVLSPYASNTEKLKDRRDLVLDNMVVLGYIDESEAKQAKAEKIAVKPREDKIEAPHFVMYVKELLVAKYGEETVEQGGFTVTTTLDLVQQKEVEKIIAGTEAHLKRSGASNAAAVVLNPRDGHILAMVGSIDYFNQARDGNVNVATSHRPPGSAFKPVVYASGFEKGNWSPGSTLFDVETNFGDNQFKYVPANYDNKFHGPVSIRQALANSYNIPAIKMLDLVGQKKVIAMAQELGITTFNEPEKYGLSMAIGGADTTLLELSGAYGAFANGGWHHKPTAITKITQGDKVLFEEKLNPKLVFRPQVAYQISSILSDNRARSTVFGTRSPLVIQGKTVAVKTGTSQDYRDALTVGYTSSRVVGIWVGNNDFSPMRLGSAGAMAAAPIWNSVMTKVLESRPDEPFIEPAGLQKIRVDAITGLKPTSGTRETREDIFADWQLPGDQGKLPSYTIYGCNGEVREIRHAYILHSERPDDSDWERPVQDWARSHGYTGTQVVDIHETCDQPSVEVADSSDNQLAVGGVPDGIEVSIPTPDIPNPVDPSPKPKPTPIIDDPISDNDLPPDDIEVEDEEAPRNGRNRHFNDDD